MMLASRDRIQRLVWSTFMTMAVPFVAVLTGCGDGRPARWPVGGSVLVDGKPAAGAIVVLHPVAGSVAAGAEQIRPTATCERDGSFVVGTWELADGVPTGRWKATVQWFVSDSASDESDPETAHLETDRLGGVYADLETTPLVVEVADAAVTLRPFDLKSAASAAR